MAHQAISDLQGVAISSSPPAQPATAAYESGWHTLFQCAGISALTVVALIPVQALVYIVWPPPSTVLEYFSVFEHNPLLGFLDLDLLLMRSCKDVWKIGFTSRPGFAG